MSNLPENETQRYLDERLLLSVWIKNATDALSYLEQGANPNTLDDEYSWSSFSKLPILFIALGWNRSGDPDLVADSSNVCALLKYGANVNARGFDGETPLLYALSTGNPEMVRILLEYGANVNLKEEKYGWTPLMLVTELESDAIELVQAMIDRGAELDVQDKDGWTALMHNAYAHMTKNVQILLKRGANPHLANNEGKTVLAIAVEEESPDNIIQILRQV